MLDSGHRCPCADSRLKLHDETSEEKDTCRNLLRLRPFAPSLSSLFLSIPHCGCRLPHARLPRPAVKYGEMENMEDESCAICLVDYEAEDELRKLPCEHAFHKPCVDSWLTVNASCPNCR
ncbi:unnamed protein product, partial [Hapterophycus canaliculatus]